MWRNLWEVPTTTANSFWAWQLGNHWTAWDHLSRRACSLGYHCELDRTPLHNAIAHGAPDDVVLALVEGWQPPVKNVFLVPDGLLRLPLHLAARRPSSPKVVAALLHACPAAVRVRDDMGCLPLHCIALRGFAQQTFEDKMVDLIARGHATETDLDAATSLPGLYAVGEVASSGVHGANRLASNSLSECLVMASQLSRLQPQPNAAAASSRCQQRPLKWTPPEDLAGPCGAPITALRQWSWQAAGVERSGRQLQQAPRDCEQLREQLRLDRALAPILQLEPGQSRSLSPSQEQQLGWLWECRQRLQTAKAWAFDYYEPL